MNGRPSWSSGCAAVVIGFAIALIGCAAPTDDSKPALDLPLSWKSQAPWREARPDDGAGKGPWWRRFGDAELDALEDQALANNPNLALASARLAQSRASLAATAAATMPQIGVGERASRQLISANRPLSNYKSPNFATVQNEFSVAMSVSYEWDLAGRVAQTIASAQAAAGQSVADFENTRLLLGADLATAYFNLRAVDAELDVLARAIDLQRRALELVASRHELGAATGLDLAQQQALLDTTRVQVDLLRRQRSQFENAVATLAGIPAPRFTLAAAALEPDQPALPDLKTWPAGLPSDLLERRPDIAAAERAMATANAQIGVARAAFYPSITLGGGLGVDSRSITTLFDAPSLLWSVGVSAAQVVFDGGRVKANVDFARAGHAAAIANYRRVVLAAMQEVEDGLAGLGALERAASQALSAVESAQRVLEMVTARYEGGASAYFDVIAAQQALLASERQATQIQGQRRVTSVFLIKALGGDWPHGGVDSAGGLSR